jgi:hypothetical protein
MALLAASHSEQLNSYFRCQGRPKARTREDPPYGVRR